MIISFAVAFRTVVTAYTMGPAVPVQFSPGSIIVGVGVGVGVGVLGCITCLVPAVVLAHELELSHQLVEFCFHFCVNVINFDLKG